MERDEDNLIDVRQRLRAAVSTSRVRWPMTEVSMRGRAAAWTA
jgi:hypothetical protein